MRNVTPIKIDKGVVVKIASASVVGGVVTVTYTDVTGTSATVEFPSSMSDAALRQSIRHHEWMKMYPPEDP